MTAESAHAILARYHAKVNHPAYTKRRRGNPQGVLKAVTFLRGTSACTMCGKDGRNELHHVDSNWRNYSLDNLHYYCKTCHLTHHKLLEMHMAKPIVYTDDMHKQIRNAVDAGVARGHTKLEMYEKLGVKYNLAPATIAKRYSHTPEQMRAVSRKYYKYTPVAGAKPRAVASRPRTANAPAIQGGVQVMTIERAIGMLQAAEQFGFAQQVSLTFLS
jgi:hypothetical protein